MRRHIDHLVHAVSDLDRAGAGYEDLGFVVTPRADHPFGTSNRLVVLEDTYIELVTVTDAGALPAEGFAANVAMALARGEGLVYVVVSSPDAESDHLRLARLSPAPVFRFSRPAPLVGGAVTTASFSCVFFDDSPGRPGDVGVFVCQHHQPSAVWNAPALDHPNGATRLRSVTLPGSASLLDTLAAVGLATVDGSAVWLDGTEVRLGPSSIELSANTDVRANVAGVVVATAVTGNVPPEPTRHTGER